jgi:iron complex transport system substrate-binding protein
MAPATSGASPSLSLADDTAAPVAAARPLRVASIDYCADQFLLKLADRAQIAAVSIDADKDFSYMRNAAAGLTRIRPTAEDILSVRPDLVIRSYGGGPQAPGLLASARVPVVQLGFAQDMAGVRANIRAVAAALGDRARGELLIARMDATWAQAARPAGDIQAMYMTAGGATAGEGAFVADLMHHAGLSVMATHHGWAEIPLELLAYRTPDVVIAAFFNTRASAVQTWSPARHPVAQAKLAARPSLMVDGAMTACGGWFLADLALAMAEARDRVQP